MKVLCVFGMCFTRTLLFVIMCNQQMIICSISCVVDYFFIRTRNWPSFSLLGRCLSKSKSRTLRRRS